MTTLTEIPDPPSYFRDIARRKWNSVSQELVNRRILTVLDLATLEVYCSSCQIVEDAREALEVEGISTMDPNTGRPMRNPTALMLQETLRENQQLVAEFGRKLMISE